MPAVTVNFLQAVLDQAPAIDQSQSKSGETSPSFSEDSPTFPLPPGAKRAGKFPPRVGKENVLGQNVGYIDVREEVAVNHLIASADLFIESEMFGHAEKVCACSRTCHFCGMCVCWRDMCVLMRAGQILDILMEVHKKRHDLKALMKCQTTFQKLYSAMAIKNECNVENFFDAESAYFLVGFHGPRLGPFLNGKQFVYREDRSFLPLPVDFILSSLLKCLLKCLFNSLLIPS